MDRSRRSSPTDTRERILEAALRLFTREGVERVSMRAIADAAGLRGPTLYAYFDDQRRILEVLMERTGPLAVIDVLRGCREGVDAVSFIRELVDEVTRRWSELTARECYALFVRESFRGPLPGGRTFHGMIERSCAAVGARFARYMASGQLRDDLAPEALAWELMAPIANLRLSYWGPQAQGEQLRRGHEIALRHTEYFIARNCPVRLG